MILTGILSNLDSPNEFRKSTDYGSQVQSRYSWPRRNSTITLIVAPNYWKNHNLPHGLILPDTHIRDWLLFLLGLCLAGVLISYLSAGKSTAV